MLLASTAIALMSAWSAQDGSLEGGQARPNILLILADDVGVEAFGSYGGQSYYTPHLDALAQGGMRFTHCYSQPLCTPSRVKLMTGMGNLSNYVNFSILDPKQRTFAHVARDAGYATVVAGKWQLFGASHYGDWRGKGSTPAQAGFESSCLWQMSELGNRYWNPVVEIDGVLQEPRQGAFGPDLFVDHLLQFAGEQGDKPFFAYFPMALVHSPFVHTPLTRTEKTAQEDQESQATRFAEMMVYMDLVVGRLVKGLDDLGLRENTLILFVGDNGTSQSIRSVRNREVVSGGKAQPTNAGTHVPLLASWPKRIVPGGVCEDLVDLSDFLPTFCEVMGVANPGGACSTHSFLPQLLGGQASPRSFIAIYSNPRPEDPARNPRVCFARNQRFKLYDDGRFFDCVADPLEQTNLDQEGDAPEQAQARSLLQGALDALPDEPEHLRGH